jgi:spore coat protein A, manganese oxidase
MKNKIYTKWVGALIALIMSSMTAIAQAPPVTSVGTATFDGTTLSVPVNVAGFINVGNISLGLTYDSSQLVYSGIILNTGLVQTNAVITPITIQTGVVRLGYTSATAVTLAAPANVLLTLNFTFKPGVTWVATPITFSTALGDCNMTPPAPGSFTPAISSLNFSTYFINGNVCTTPIPTITGPAGPNMQESVSGGVSSIVYTTEAGMSGYTWATSPSGAITAGAGTNSVTVTWTNPTGQQWVSVNYTTPGGCTAPSPMVLLITYYPFSAEIDPTTIPQFVDPLPHFAAGLRVNAKAGGSLLIKAVPVRQVAVSTGTTLSTGTVGTTPGAGLGNYAAYAISKDGGATFGPAMWPAQTIETQQGNGLTVQYENHLTGVRYSDFNILADQTLMMNGYDLNGNILKDPYNGDIPMVTHLHGGEIPSNSDGGPTAWFTPGFNKYGPGFTFQASSLATYPNKQEEATLWYHPHDQGLTRINVYTGLAGFYFLRGATEEADHLPGWSGDDKVQEVTPPGKTATFNGTNAYLPEIEVAIQDRMFNVKGELYWPVTPTNPDIHPYWTPEFFGDVFTVNGKTWPYLSVAARKYRFRMLDGCNARFLNLWLENAANGQPGPSIKVIGTDGGLLDAPVTLDPATAQTLFMAPGERFDVVIDFTGIPEGTTFTLKNDAAAPYPTGDPVIPGLTDRVMQFVVNGKMVLTGGGGPGTDKSQLPGNLRPSNPLVKLTDFAGNLTPGVVPTTKRQIILNEVTGAGGPVQVLFNNSHFDGSSPIPGAPTEFGGPTELPREGTTELIKIINTTVDAHPIHVHLLQWQLVSRQNFNTDTYMAAYNAAWALKGIPEWPAGLGYPGGSGSPFRYDSINADGAVGGNPAISPFLTGVPVPPSTDEMGWKDDIKAFPGEVATYIVRIAPTDRPINATQQQLLFPFDPSLGPGYVWHCHIIDHEDMDMMRPLMIQPSFLRFPQITAQPVAAIVCAGDMVKYSVTATSDTPITYKWQLSTDAGVTWTDLTNTAPYTGIATSTLSVNPAALPQNSYQFRCTLTNIDGVTISNGALLTVNNCTVSGTLNYNNGAKDPLAGMKVTIDGKNATTDATGAFTVTGVRSGNQLVTVNPGTKVAGGVNATDAALVLAWALLKPTIPNVTYLAGDVNTDHSINGTDATGILKNYLLKTPFSKPWVFWKSIGSGKVYPPAFTVPVNGQSVTGFNILALSTGDFNGSYNPNGIKSARTNVQITSVDTRNIGADQEFDLLLKAATPMEVGAVSLAINIPSDLVEVKGAYLKNTDSPITFEVQGNQLWLGWNTVTPVSVNAESELIILRLRSTASFTEGRVMELSAEFDPLNEIADGSLEPIKDAVLKTDKIIAKAVIPGDNAGSALSLSVTPNPVSGFATLYYSLPEDGLATIQIYNTLGEDVSTLVSKQHSRGNYSLPLDVSKMSDGIHMVTLKFRSSDKDLVTTIKFIVNK